MLNLRDIAKWVRSYLQNLLKFLPFQVAMLLSAAKMVWPGGSITRTNERFAFSKFQPLKGSMNLVNCSIWTRPTYQAVKSNRFTFGKTWTNVSENFSYSQGNCIVTATDWILGVVATNFVERVTTRVLERICPAWDVWGLGGGFRPSNFEFDKYLRQRGSPHLAWREGQASVITKWSSPISPII